MADTRPSGFALIPDTEVPIIQELAEIDGRGRLHLLPRWAKRTTWLPVPASTTSTALMILDEPGCLSLANWEPNGPKIIERFRELNAAEGGTDFEALRLIVDRYRRLPIPVERRPSLGDAALQHLGLPTTRGLVSNVYVVVVQDRISVLSPVYRNSKAEQSHPALDQLP